MKRHGNLWESLIDYENLWKAYKNARKGKTWQKQIKEVDADPHQKIKDLQQMLIKKQYVVSPYKVKIIYEPKEREIFIVPFYPDRIIHHALMNIIAPIYDKKFIRDSYSCREGKGQHKGSFRCMEFITRNKYVLQCDISKFYPSIKHEILLDIIRHKIKDKNVLWLIEKIVKSFPGGKNVPIGNYTSQWFGNIYMNELDTYIKQELHIKDYERYCDDFLIFGNDKKELNEIAKKVKEFCNNKLDLKLSKLSLYPVSKGVDFLGYRHFPNKMILRKSTAKRFKARLKELRWELKNGLIEIDKARSTVDSILGWISHAQTYNLIKAWGIEELRGDIMKGFPKNLNSKYDYYYIKNNFNEVYWKPLWQLLLDNRFEWYFVERLENKEDGIEDDTHKIVETNNMDEGEIVYEQYEYRENKNAKIYKLGFTVEEVENALKE